MNFFEKFKQAEYEFTYGAEDDPEHHNALQVGLVAWFYLDKGYTQENRARIAEAYMIYHREYGENLKWGYIKNPKEERHYNNVPAMNFKKEICESFGEDFNFIWSSEKGFRYAGEYYVEFHSPSSWFESIHRPVSYFGFHLPVNKINDAEKNEKLIANLCSILQPLHGSMGLGIQQCQEKERYQHLEYNIGLEFLGIDITNSRTDKFLRNGIRTVNWYTFFNEFFLKTLGGMNYLSGALSDPAVKIIPYSGGVIIRAGKTPELGWINDNPYPELYVKVNKILKPIRAPEIGSLGYGSIAGELRFDDNSTAQWLSRFDVELPPVSTVPAVKDPLRITRWTGETAPHAGQWAAMVNGATKYIQTREGQKMPEYEDKYGKHHRACWSLLKRDDKGSVFITPE